MISPSKVQHQQQQHNQPTRDNFDTHSHVRLQKGRKPLERKSFYLDIKNHALAASLEAKIKDLGGVTELFLVRSVTLAVSDRADKLLQNSCDKRKKWGYGSGGSGGPPSLRSVEVPTPVATPPTPFGGEYPLSNSTNTRCQTAQRTKSRADAMLERALTQPQQCSVDPLDNAQSWGIPIWATKKLQAWLEKIYDSLKETGDIKRSADQSNADRSLKVKNLKNSYIKFESFKRDTRPVFLELPVWPKLNFDGDHGTCPFDSRTRGKKVCKQESASLNKEKGKEMTRRPRATATRARRTEQLVAGHCEICRIDYRDLSKHVQSDKHVAFIRNDDNFLALDKLIDAGASVEAFLRANDVGSDCSVYPDGHGTLVNVDLENEKTEKGSKSDLANFAVEEIKMVQCNGARRNLNLKLDSPHNLRTRAKHESGHLLRSKGSPWHETVHEKTEKFYDKYEGFTIKKRSKGTIWIEEDENPMKKCSMIDDGKEIEIGDATKLGPTSENVYSCSKTDNRPGNPRNSDSIDERSLPKLERNDLAITNEIDADNTRIINIPHLEKETRTNERSEIVENGGSNVDEIIRNPNDLIDDCTNGFNGFERIKPPESFPACQLPGNSNTVESNAGKKSPIREITTNEREIVISNGPTNNDGKMENSRISETKLNDEKPKTAGRIGKRRGYRGRPRLSVEERLIEDNRAYYKVEVLGNKLRSSTGPWTATGQTNAAAKPEESVVPEDSKKDDEPSSEKPVVVRFKRVRRSELSLLSDEAESFMFGEPKRDDGTSSETSDDDQTSILPRDTESEVDDAAGLLSNDRSVVTSSSMRTSSPIKQELIIDEDSQDSIYNGRAKKRRRTQAEMLLKENEEYYTFETPGSRLRYQGLGSSSNKEHPTVGRKSARQTTETQPQPQQRPRKEDVEKPPPEIVDEKTSNETVEKLYPSKPSPEVEKMQFSFEAVPRSEPWYQTYQRQDEGAEFWHCFSEADERRPFLLPYEIENFHETLAKIVQKNDGRRKNRRGANGIGRSPRKSPRCHASTLAIMSTLIRKREQLQQPTNLSVLEEETTPAGGSGASNASRSRDDTPKPETKRQPTPERSKPDTDVELRDIAKSIDVMLSADGMLDLDDSFEAGLVEHAENSIDEAPALPRGPPPDLLDLLDNCHGYFNCRENSSCASSECGENTVESPLKRRKRRKNRTGWPGIKMRKKSQNKQTVDVYPDVDASSKKLNDEKVTSNVSGTSQSLGERLRPITTDGPTVEKSSEIIDTENHENYGKDGSEAIANSRSSATIVKCPTIEIGTTERDKSSGNVDEAREPRRKTNEEARGPPVQCETITGSEETTLISNDESYVRNEKISVTTAESSENSMTNDENHENAVSTRQNGSKSIARKRSAVNDDTSETMDSRREIAKNDNLYIKNVKSSIISRKNYSTNGIASSKRRNQVRDSAAQSDSPDSEKIAVDQRREVVASCQKTTVITRKPMTTRKRQRPGTLRSDVAYDNENCKNSTTVKNLKTNDTGRNVKRRNNETPSAESLETDYERGIVERVSPPLPAATELQNRRSSIEFQPVVRMMKIEDQVDMDHSILSVTVASNRRLRSSSSPRSNAQPPAKRYKRSKGPFGRWLKNS